jgi:hypothetical protein
MRGKPFLPLLRADRRIRLPEPTRAALAQRVDRFPGVRAPLFRPGVGELGVVLGRHVAQVAHHVHDLVIAQKRHHPAAATCRPPFEGHHELEGCPHRGAAVDQIAELDQDRVAAGPRAASVDEAGLDQDRLERGQVSMHIADRHDPRRRVRRRRQSEPQADDHRRRPPGARESSPDSGHCRAFYRAGAPGFSPNW